MDPWRYPLVPAIRLLLQNETDDASEWYDVPIENITISMYASPLGIPYVPMPSKNSGTFNFFLKSSYFRFTCSGLEVATKEEIIQSTGANFVVSDTGTLYLDMVAPSSNEVGIFKFASLITNGSNNSYISTGTFAYLVCNFSQVFVESDTLCENYLSITDCLVQSIRQIPRPPDLISLEPFDRFLVNASTPPVIANVTAANTPTLIERYLADPDRVLHDMTSINLRSQINDTETLERRISRLFNTFWQAGFDPMYQTGFYETVENTKLKLNFTNGENHHNVSTIKIDATFIDASDTYIVYWPWLAVLIACSIILFVAGVAGAIWESQTIGPDVLGFASSIIRQSKYIDVPKAGKAMSGAERAYMMGGVHVMMQDVKPKTDVGKIALGVVSDTSHRLRVGRRYC